MPAVVEVATVDAVSAATPAEDGTTRNSNSNITVSEDSNNSNKVGERARGRWKLLRRAIVRSAATAAATKTTTTTATTNDAPNHSIHCFAGYHLLPPCAASVTRASRPDIWEQLLVLQLPVETKSVTKSATATTTNALQQMLVDSMLALTAMDPVCRLLEFSISLLRCPDDTDTDDDNHVQDAVDKEEKELLTWLQQHQYDWSLQLQRQCAWKTCDCQWREVVAPVPDASASASANANANANANATNRRAAHRWMLRIPFEPVEAHPQYTIREYSTNTNASSISSVSANDDNDGNADSDDKMDNADSGDLKNNNNNHHHLADTVPTTPPPPAIVLARERMPTRQVSLQELVSHHYQRYDNNKDNADNSNDNRGIDNTGNICVWDCEKTLAWVLLREQKQLQRKQLQFSSGVTHIASASPTTTTTTAAATTAAGPRIVTELGAGMVGLAGLCLVAAAANHNHDNGNSNGSSNGISNDIQELYLTDGHVDSVTNNRVHVRLGQAVGQLPQSSAPRSSRACRVHCSVLKWSIDSDEQENNSNTNTNQRAAAAAAVDTTSPLPPPPADWTLVSDCTHFEEYHAELFWTLIKCTVSTGGGTIWMCQPDRGKSLDRFLDLVRAVNGGNNNDTIIDGSNTSTAALVIVQEQHYETLRAKHDELLQRDKTYDPNIHRPRVFCLRKLRAETQQDRLVAIRHIQER
jgi:hypothetical protein